MEHIQWKQSMLRYNDLRVLLVYKVIAVSSTVKDHASEYCIIKWESP